MPAPSPSKPEALAAIQRGEDPKTVAERHGVAWPTFRVWMSRWRKKGAIQNMKAAATWEDIGSLTPWDKNPRHNAAAIEQVRKSIERFGFSSPIIARQQDRVIIAGHTRHQAALKMGLDKVPVRFLDLDPAQARALALADNRLGEVAEWDDGMLSEVLAELEAESVDLDGLGWSDEELAALIRREAEPHNSSSGGESGYTTKLKAPTYDPKGDNPPLESLTDQNKTADLLKEINSADIPDDIREFLRSAAHRHTVFHFARIAEFYCHADAAVQDLMERSALVIIDFDKAIENGFVHLSEQLGALVPLDKGTIYEG
jgi:hypothetical protein